MDPAPSLDELFLRAIDLDESARRRLLDGLDAGVRAELEELLDYDRRPTAAALRPAAVPRDESPPRVAGYRIREELGSGGMGTVFLADQLEPIERTVAVKVVRQGLATREVLNRFEAERRTLARMQHPNIASVFDGGLTDDGRPFFAMEYVDGPSVTEHADARRLDLDARLALFLQVCRGVEHAHRRGVIHRDLKPSNLLVAEHDGDHLVKIIDFGVAKALQPEPGDERTLHGQVIGTPDYMAPEQRRGEEADTRADVHALGVVLHELLLGRRPRSATADGAATTERLTRPSTWWRRSTTRKERDEIAARRALDAWRLSRRLHGDLDQILLTATAEDPDQRYAGPRALADDIERHRTGLPIEAGRTTPFRRLSRFVRRNRAIVAAIAIVIVGLGTALAWSRHDAQRAERLLAEVRRLSDDRLIDELERSSRLVLWPTMPERIPQYREWLHSWEELLARLPDHRARADALAATLAARASESEAVRRDLVWELSILRGLISKVEQLRESESRAGPSGVRSRLALAERLRDEVGPAHASAWEAAIEAIADVDRSPRYAGYRLPGPQTDLVPLGQNEASGLWEFWLATSGDRPEWNAVGEFRLRREDGLVFVLIPPGSFWMGARAAVEGPGPASSLDPSAAAMEGPPHEIRLDAFYLSKFELTQGQVFAWTGNDASGLQASRLADQPRPRLCVGWTNPVEQASWSDLEHLLMEMGCRFPTEAQWEYAARGGRSGPHARGGEDLPLDRLANLGDAPSAPFLRKPPGSLGAGLDDGHAVHAPVGSFAPNGFGLFDVLGNVGEWCADWVAPYTEPVADGSGLRLVDGRGNGNRVIRGGNFESPPQHARVTIRGAASPTARLHTVGVRPARWIEAADDREDGR